MNLYCASHTVNSVFPITRSISVHEFFMHTSFTPTPVYLKKKTYTVILSYPIMFVFVRHGESESNRFIHTNADDLSVRVNAIGDPTLTELGHRQALATASFLRTKLEQLGSPVIAVRTSLFARTQQTAAPFSELYRENITESDSTRALLEWTPPRKQLTDAHMNAGLTHDESWSAFETRVKEFANWMSENAGHDSNAITVVFGHSVFIGALFSFLGTQCTWFPGQEEVSFELPNCSISTVVKIPCRWSIHYVGAISHLSGELGVVWNKWTRCGKARLTWDKWMLSWIKWDLSRNK